MSENLDVILKRVLTPTDEPGDILNEKILKQVKEREPMRQKKYKYMTAAVITASLVAATSLTAVAAWQYRSAGNVAEKAGDNELAKAFEAQESAAGQPAGEMEGALQSQTYGDYKATLLGVTSGSGLTEFPRTHNGEIREDRTYCAVMIQRADGTPIEEDNGDFFVSPLIGGLNPGLYNAMSLFGDLTWFVEDGVYYQLLACENIEYFADHELYVCVTDTSMYNSALYYFDEASGKITRNEDYEGLNALFSIVLDASKADPEKAQALINLADGLDENGNPLPEPEVSGMPAEVEEFMEMVMAETEADPENIDIYCQRMENTVQTAMPDENGNIQFDKPWLVNEKVSDSRGGNCIKGDYFAGKQVGFYITGYDTASGLEDLVIETYEINEDGSITFAAYVPREISLYLE